MKRRSTRARRATPTRPAPIRALEAEHRNFEGLLHLFESELALFHRGEEPDYALMRDIMLYLTQYPDRFHHPNEDVIFARLQQVDPSTRDAVAQLERQHGGLRAQGSELLVLLDEVLADALMSRDDVETPARAYAAALRAHMDREERELFPLAASRLGTRDWAAITSALHRYDDPLFGAQLDPGYRAIFERLVPRRAA